MANKIERVVIIGLDGAGNFIKETETPNIDGLLEKGVLTYSAQANSPTISAECWGSLLHGVSPDVHGLNNDIVATKTYPEDSDYPSIFKIIKQADPASKLAAFSAWEPINHGIIEQSSQDHSVSQPDAELADSIATYILENKDGNLIYVQLDGPDAAGHQYGYGTKSYLKSITEADKHVGTILNALQKANLVDSSLVIVTADHGGGGDDPYSHGSDHPQDKTVFWGCHGPGINTEIELKTGFPIMNTAAIVLYALGIEPPKSFEAEVPEGLFLKDKKV
ncbi:phosphodiesterase [Bacillus sp. J14TS2]|uniref:alkaline phosphatase family protein n=1 Tax=Bacillus sp. J14TS2 TaxID=2807188 RepID=UPI001B267D5B|nr:alkaline phosphatase [Bacillus sp. J14TS2]GIN74639.1 phosphodiesterase [Bacillus sp. J14TS2]